MSTVRSNSRGWDKKAKEYTIPLVVELQSYQAKGVDTKKCEELGPIMQSMIDLNMW